MKGLLHSKRFKRNLKRWICMYVGVLVLFTSVVTYSRYVSNLSLNDEAKVTKFNVNIGKGEASTESGKDPFLPTDTIYYTFTVTPNFEVKTLLALTINAEERFIIESIIENPGKGEIEIYNKDIRTQNVGAITVSADTTVDGNNDNTKVVISRTISSAEAKPTTYKIALKFKYEDIKETYYTLDEYLREKAIVNVDYSARQLLN